MGQNRKGGRRRTPLLTTSGNGNGASLSPEGGCTGTYPGARWRSRRLKNLLEKDSSEPLFTPQPLPVLFLLGDSVQHHPFLLPCSTACHKGCQLPTALCRARACRGPSPRRCDGCATAAGRGAGHGRSGGIFGGSAARARPAPLPGPAGSCSERGPGPRVRPWGLPVRAALPGLGAGRGLGGAGRGDPRAGPDYAPRAPLRAGGAGPRGPTKAAAAAGRPLLTGTGGLGGAALRLQARP